MTDKQKLLIQELNQAREDVLTARAQYLVGARALDDLDLAHQRALAKLATLNDLLALTMHHDKPAEPKPIYRPYKRHTEGASTYDPSNFR